eukprot:TRINITY_DN7598_c0_g1_i1.p1 TRINITY_DN7598_c0_g1~~TRINITY_DN7598_c0_g1_i1.p1  ORF type:complete len:1358 (-),score=370.90 TRINITY_DN7598_c0_g1_i1:135-4208(-)
MDQSLTSSTVFPDQFGPHSNLEHLRTLIIEHRALQEYLLTLIPSDSVSALQWGARISRIFEDDPEQVLPLIKTVTIAEVHEKWLNVHNKEVAKFHQKNFLTKNGYLLGGMITEHCCMVSHDLMRSFETVFKKLYNHPKNFLYTPSRAPNTPTVSGDSTLRSEKLEKVEAIEDSLFSPRMNKSLIQNRKNLEMLMEKLLEHLSNVAFPGTMRDIARIIFKVMGGGDGGGGWGAPHLAVGKFLFLRFLCPALLSPVNFELIPVSFANNRPVHLTLALISRLLARLVEGPPSNSSDKQNLAVPAYFDTKTQPVLSSFNVFLHIKLLPYIPRIYNNLLNSTEEGTCFVRRLPLRIRRRDTLAIHGLLMKVLREEQHLKLSSGPALQGGANMSPDVLREVEHLLFEIDNVFGPAAKEKEEKEKERKQIEDDEEKGLENTSAQTGRDSAGEGGPEQQVLSDGAITKKKNKGFKITGGTTSPSEESMTSTPKAKKTGIRRLKKLNIKEKSINDGDGTKTKSGRGGDLSKEVASPQEQHIWVDRSVFWWEDQRSYESLGNVRPPVETVWRNPFVKAESSLRTIASSNADTDLTKDDAFITKKAKGRQKGKTFAEISSKNINNYRTVTIGSTTTKVGQDTITPMTPTNVEYLPNGKVKWKEDSNSPPADSTKRPGRSRRVLSLTVDSSWLEEHRDDEDNNSDSDDGEESTDYAEPHKAEKDVGESVPYDDSEEPPPPNPLKTEEALKGSQGNGALEHRVTKNKLNLQKPVYIQSKTSGTGPGHPISSSSGNASGETEEEKQHRTTGLVHLLTGNSRKKTKQKTGKSSKDSKTGEIIGTSETPKRGTLIGQTITIPGTPTTSTPNTPATPTTPTANNSPDHNDSSTSSNSTAEVFSSNPNLLTPTSTAIANKEPAEKSSPSNLSSTNTSPLSANAGTGTDSPPSGPTALKKKKKKKPKTIKVTSSSSKSSIPSPFLPPSSLSTALISNLAPSTSPTFATPSSAAAANAAASTQLGHIPSSLQTFNLSEITPLEPLAVTPSGTVRRALWRGTKVALKEILLPLPASSLTSSLSVVTDFYREVEILSHLRHPNIVSLMAYGVKPEGQLMIIMELMEQGSLDTLLHTTHKSRLSLLQKIDILLGIAKGMSFIHLSKIIHGDLKPRNVLIELIDPEVRVKICDFGLSKTKEHTVTFNANDKSNNDAMLRGTAAYMAPELLDSEPSGKYGGKSDEKVDVYSFGIVVWEVMTECKPWEGKSLVQLIYPVLSGKRPGGGKVEVKGDGGNGIREEMERLYKRCTEEEASKRGKWEEIEGELEKERGKEKRRKDKSDKEKERMDEREKEDLKKRVKMLEEELRREREKNEGGREVS